MVFHSSGPSGQRAATDAQVQIAIVTGGQRVLHLAVAATREALEPELVAYVGRHAEEHLYPQEAHRVRYLIEQGRGGAAVRHYFAHVGQRWDAEQLTIRSIALEPQLAH